LKAQADVHGINLLVQGLGPVIHTGFTDMEEVSDFRDVQQYDKVKLKQFIAGLHDAGVRVIGRGLWYISAAHTDEDIDHALRISNQILQNMSQHTQ
jgi:glutamate-1-semialdehyde 2,1-aminomutase